jgi:hypothetical protein
MTDAYSPIVRTFCRIRSAFTNNPGVARHEVRPATPLDVILPTETRREAWKQLQRQGFRLPDLEFAGHDHWRNFLIALKATGSFALHIQSWYALLFALPLMFIVSRARRHRAVQFPLGLSTVGELVIYATRFSEHKDSGYRWTRNEIAMKVRMIVAESVGMPLVEIQPETNLLELSRRIGC